MQEALYTRYDDSSQSGMAYFRPIFREWAARTCLLPVVDIILLNFARERTPYRVHHQKKDTAHLDY